MARGLQLDTADRYASKIAEWLTPHCMRLQITGEVRRRCSSCELIEVLSLPRRTPAGNDLFNFLDDYVTQSGARAWWEHESGAAGLKGFKPPPDAFRPVIHLPKCTLRIWVATETTWFPLLIDSTGSYKHAMSLHGLIRSRHGPKAHWSPLGIIQLPAGPFVAREEAEIYDLAGVPWLEPSKRV